MSAADDREDESVVAPAVFVVRVRRASAGQLAGVVERVATGEKRGFGSAGEMVALIQRMLDGPDRRAEGPADGRRGGNEEP